MKKPPKVCSTCGGTRKVIDIVETRCQNGCCSTQGDFRPSRVSGCTALLEKCKGEIPCPECRNTQYK